MILLTASPDASAGHQANWPAWLSGLNFWFKEFCSPVNADETPVHFQEFARYKFLWNLSYWYK